MPNAPEKSSPNADILIVEDSPTQAQRLEHVLSSRGYQVRVAGNGRLALMAMAVRRPDFVLSDIVMPEMDGYALCKAIKDNPNFPDVPVVLVTSLTNSGEVVRGLECGADNFIRKPYSDDYLLSYIDQILQRKVHRQARHLTISSKLYVGENEYQINAGRQQILDLLISTFEQAVMVNGELQAREREVNELNSTLAQRASELESTNQEMARQNVELKLVSRLKSEFLSNMSHELRTPLNAIIGFSAVLKDGFAGPLNEQQKKFVDFINDGGKHLLALINDILDLSKIEAGKMTLDMEPTDLTPLVESCLNVVREKAIAHHLTLQLEAPPLGWVMADQRKTKQLVYNLLSNAVKFTPDEGRVTLSLRLADLSDLPVDTMGSAWTGEDERFSKYLVLSVTDTGIGISKEDLKRLFQPFMQIDNSLSRVNEGSGLGLALVRQIVELHRGRLSVQSEPGVGSVFTVYLPYREASAPAPMADEAAPAPASAAAKPMSDQTSSGH